ncbi:MAG: fibronectin type III domain-containing protein [Microgenomates group bacterium]
MNKGKKIFLIIAVIILVIAIPLGVILISRNTKFRLGAQSGKNPENVQILNLQSNSATIVWRTNVPTQGAVVYGINPSSLSLIQPETALTTDHQVVLNNLLPATTYYFLIKIEDKNYDNNGQPYYFTTKPKEITSTPSPTPFVPSPTLIPTPGEKITEEKIKEFLGTNNPLYDLNKDGQVNTLDILLFRQQNNK